MTDILCIGSVLWDVIGRCPDPMKHGFDCAGHIRRHPGGVAYNIAKALSNLNLSPALITSLGQGTEGDELIQSCDRDGMRTAAQQFHTRPLDDDDGVAGAQPQA